MRSMSSVSIALLLLAGCGSGGGPSVSGSASESARSETGFSSLWEKVRGVSVEQTKTIEMPAFALIADAFAEQANRDHLDPAGARGLLIQHDEGEPPRSLAAEIVYVENLVPRDPKAPNSPLPDYKVLALPLYIASSPLRGWEVPAIDDREMRRQFDNPFFRGTDAFGGRPAYDPALHLAYMRMLAASAMYANAVYAGIAARLGGATLADPDAARARIIEAWHAIPPAQLRHMLATITDRVGRARFTADLAGASNVHFLADGIGDFTGDARGIVWTWNGTPWFGDGHIAGQTMTFRLGAASTLSQREAQTGTTGASTGSDVAGTGSIGAGR